jgi:type I site-specific restriction-modification system R (restriction) subunit
MALEIQQSINQILGGLQFAGSVYGHSKAPERAQQKKVAGLHEEQAQLTKEQEAGVADYEKQIAEIDAMKHLTTEEKNEYAAQLADSYEKSYQYAQKRLSQIDKQLYSLDPKYRQQKDAEAVEKGRTEAMKEIQKRYAERMKEQAAREQVMNPVAEEQIGRIKHAISPEGQRQSTADSMTEKIKRGGNL